jgi:hypothetical protein
MSYVDGDGASVLLYPLGCAAFFLGFAAVLFPGGMFLAVIGLFL